MLRRQLIAVVGLALTATACGSTVQTSSGPLGAASGEGLDAAGSGLTAPGGNPSGMEIGEIDTGGATPLSGSSGSATTGGRAAAAGAAGGTGAAGAAGGSPVQGSGASGAGASADGPALTRPIKIGYTVADLGAAADALGTAGYNADQQAQATRDQWKALISHANRNGGVGGRKIEGKEYSVSGTTDPNALCTQATEDDKVDAFLDYDSFNQDAHLACFAKHHTPLIAQLFSPSRELVLQYRPYLATTYGVPDRVHPAMIEGLNRVGYFKNATVGAILDDVPLMRKMWTTKMKPQLERMGVKVEAEHYFSPLDPGQQQTQAQTAVLDFKSKGVTHVLVNANVLVLISFSQAEQNADYYARLGLGDFMLTASAAPGNAQYIASVERALKDAVAVTLASSAVLDRPEQKKGSTIDRNNPQLLPGMRRCLDVLSAELKVDYYKLGSNQRGRGWPQICDSFFLWWETAKKTGAPLTRVNWGTRLPDLGTSFQSALVHKQQFSATQYDGAADYRVGRYYHESVACGCYKALLPGWYPLPSS